MQKQKITQQQEMKIKGKYLKPVRDYVATLELGDGFLVKMNPEYEELKTAFLQLKGEYVSADNADSILWRELYSFYFENESRVGPLNQAENQDLFEGLVERIKTCIESYPKSYIFRIELPSFPNFGVASFDVSSDVRIAIGQKKLSSKNALFDLLAATNKPPHEDFAAYIEVRGMGYASGSLDSPATASCLSKAKQCAFILTAFGSIHRNYDRSPPANATLLSAGTDAAEAIVLHGSIARYFGYLTPNEERLTTFDFSTGAGLLGGSPRPAETDREKQDALKALLQPAIRYFSCGGHPDFESISAAIDWCQDSMLAENQTFSYLAACIGLEALLGSDEHMDQMSKRLPDRYAFMLGKGRSQRDNLSKQYQDVLRLRGRLVHAREARLKGDDGELLRTAKEMLLNVIWHELHEMYRQTPAEPALA